MGMFSVGVCGNGNDQKHIFHTVFFLSLSQCNTTTEAATTEAGSSNNNG